MNANRGDRLPAPRSARLRYFALGMVLGTAVAIAAVIALVVATRERLDPPITPGLLDGAVARWAEHGPENYDLQIELSGVHEAVVQAEIRDGKPVHVAYNGRELQSRQWDDWTVPGLFSFIRIDLEACMNAQQRPVKERTGEVAMPRGIFDPHYGYPLSYRRVTPTGADAKWRVRFEKK